MRRKPRHRHRSSFSGLRRWGIALQVVFSAIAFLAVVVMVNYLSSRHYERFHWSRDPRFQLSPMTVSLLRTLTNDVKVIVLSDPEESDVASSVKGLLTEYKLSNPHINVEYINYINSPGRAELVKTNYRVGDSGDSILVIFDSNGRHQVIRERELSEFDLSQAMEGKVKRVGFKGEQVFTSALLGVTDPHPLKAYYLVGHGERTLDSETASDGFSQFVDLLKQKNIDVQPLLLRTNDIPDDCQLLILAGPRMPIPTDELQRVRRYLDNGGRALILTLSPVRQDVRRTGLEQLLTEWNVLVGDDLVIDPKLARSDAPQFLMTDFFGNHPIMHPLQGTRLGLVMPNSVRERSRSDRTGSPIHVTELIFTSPAGTSVSNFRGTAETNGVIPLAVAVEKGAIAGVDTTRGTSRMVVVGEANFLGNAVLDFEGNRDFAMLAVNWLLDRRQLLAIGPRPIREYRISLTRPQIRTAGWILLGAMPGSVLLLGFLVWLRRRK